MVVLCVRLSNASSLSSSAPSSESRRGEVGEREEEAPVWKSLDWLLDPHVYSTPSTLKAPDEWPTAWRHAEEG